MAKVPTRLTQVVDMRQRITVYVAQQMKVDKRCCDFERVCCLKSDFLYNPQCGELEELPAYTQYAFQYSRSPLNGGGYV